MSGVKLTNIVKSYGSLTAVDNVSLDIKEGEFLTFLGPSGCGKTTTLRLISGFVQPTSGNIYFGDKDVTGFSHSIKRGFCSIWYERKNSI